MTDSIDEVIQSGAAFSPRLRKRASNSNLSINRTAPIPRQGSPPIPANNDPISPGVRLHPAVSRNEGVSERPASRGIQGSIREDDEFSRSSRSGNTATESAGNGGGSNITDFFSSEVFQIVIHNPTTAHRFLRFCQSRNCGENMEFLQAIEAYNRLLDEVTQALSTIHSTFTGPGAPKQINISHPLAKRVTSDIRQTTQKIIPSLENIFAPTQEHVERLLASDIYPRFVRHQVTAQATIALSDHRERYPGLGDCFCMTDPMLADNPIVFASDGFVSVTGYSRKDIIPRNCRFLQGEQTDPNSTTRLRQSIENCEETVELLLNYRKNGDPFWNLLYMSPLLDESGEVVFFLGGQINCSTTIHSCTDVLKVLSINDDELDRIEEAGRAKSPSARSKNSNSEKVKLRSSFFKSFKKYNASTAAKKINVRAEAGMEPELINRFGKLTFKTQVEAFYTAYSKYLVLQYQPTTQHLIVRHYSPGVIDMLCLNLPNGGIAPIFNKDIFRILAEHSSSGSSSTARAFKETVRNSINRGKAVSVETGLLTGYVERKPQSGFGRLALGSGSADRGFLRVEERYVTHWTPVKDEEGRPKWVVLTIAPKA